MDLTRGMKVRNVVTGKEGTVAKPPYKLSRAGGTKTIEYVDTYITRVNKKQCMRTWNTDNVRVVK
jgi:hypothetical protein